MAPTEAPTNLGGFILVWLLQVLANIAVFFIKPEYSFSC